MQNFILGKDINGNVTYDIPLPNPKDLTNNFRCAVAASTEKTLTVPDGANSMLVASTPGSSIVVGIGSVALTASTPDFTNLNGHITPVKRFVSPGDTVRVLNLDSANPAEVSITFYSLEVFNG